MQNGQFSSLSSFFALGEEEMDDGHYLKTELRTRYDTIQIFIKPKRKKEAK